MGPEDAMPIDSSPNLPHTEGYERVIRGRDVFSRISSNPVTDASVANNNIDNGYYDDTYSV